MPSMLNCALSFQCGRMNLRFSGLTILQGSEVYCSCDTVLAVHWLILSPGELCFSVKPKILPLLWTHKTLLIQTEFPEVEQQQNQEIQFTELGLQETYLIADSSCFHSKFLQNQIVFK